MWDKSRRSSRRTAMASACGAASFVAASAGDADAAIIAYDFDATVTTGPYAGVYSGSFSYDDQTPPHAVDPPYEFVALEQFAFHFEGQDFGLADIMTFTSPGVRLEDGVFAGLGGVNTGEGGLLFVSVDATGGWVAFEGESSSGYITPDFFTGTVSYQLPEPAQGVLMSAAFLTLACQKRLVALWTRFRRRPTSGAGFRTPWRAPASLWRRATKPRASGVP